MKEDPRIEQLRNHLYKMGLSHTTVKTIIFRVKEAFDIEWYGNTL